MGGNVGEDDDGTSRTPLISLPCSTLPYSVLSCFVCLLEFNVEEIMHKLYPASHEESPTKDTGTHEEHAS